RNTGSLIGLVMGGTSAITSALCSRGRPRTRFGNGRGSRRFASLSRRRAGAKQNRMKELPRLDLSWLRGVRRACWLPQLKVRSWKFSNYNQRANGVCRQPNFSAAIGPSRANGSDQKSSHHNQVWYAGEVLFEFGFRLMELPD